MGIHSQWMPNAMPPAFDWDGANISRIGRHSVTASEVEQVIAGASLPLGSPLWGAALRPAINLA
jgi:hypothetical protein